MNSFSDQIQKVSIHLVPFMMAVIFHEYAHGWVAARWGDSTAKDQGRLTLNPIPHMDLFGCIIFPAIFMLLNTPLLFGWAKPVPINPSRFRKYRQGLFCVSFAGPCMNFLLAFCSAICCCAIRAWVPSEFYLYVPLINMAYVSIPLNYGLGLFNLIPIPPLDGSKIVESFLSYEQLKKYSILNQYSSFILMGLLLTGALSILSLPIQFLTEWTLTIISLIF